MRDTSRGAGWLDCPLKRQDQDQVAQLLAEASWPPDVQEMLSCGLRSAAAPKDGLPLPPTGSPPIIRTHCMAILQHIYIYIYLCIMYKIEYNTYNRL